ncbi:hypothetical protein BC834DRAFT_388070 [Gloeopeniophorella convolvens]|nr:hypothetical protein BC834DRAFT_388070 [Gloeopeniophorella convolvens]
MMEDAVDDCFAKIRDQDLQLAEIRQMIEAGSRMREENHRRQERIRKKDQIISQLDAEVEYGRRLLAESELRNAEKRARNARWEAQINENYRRMAQGLPPIILHDS